jgi:hypothetical protein
MLGNVKLLLVRLTLLIKNLKRTISIIRTNENVKR